MVFWRLLHLSKNQISCESTLFQSLVPPCQHPYHRPSLHPCAEARSKTFPGFWSCELKNAFPSFAPQEQKFIYFYEKNSIKQAHTGGQQSIYCQSLKPLDMPKRKRYQYKAKGGTLSPWYKLMVPMYHEVAQGTSRFACRFSPTRAGEES